MKQSLVVGLCVAFLYACGGSDGGTGTTLPPTAAEQFTQDLQGLSLDAFYDTSIATLVQRSPETLIWRSLLDTYPQAEARLDDLSDDYRRETFTLYQIALDALRTYDRATLDGAGQLNYDAYEWFLQDVTDRLQFIYYDYPGTYGIFGVPRDTEQLFTEVHPIDSFQDAQDYVTRLGHVETKFTQLANHLDLQQQNGVVEPGLTMQVATNQIAAMAQMNATASPYYTTLVDKMANHPGISDAQRNDLATQALALVDGGVRRGYQ